MNRCSVGSSSPKRSATIPLPVFLSQVAGAPGAGELPSVSFAADGPTVANLSKSGEIADIGSVGQTIQTLLKISKVKTKNAATKPPPSYAPSSARAPRSQCYTAFEPCLQ